MNDKANKEEKAEASTREKRLKMLLIIIAAALAATILSLLTQDSDEDSGNGTETSDESSPQTSEEGTAVVAASRTAEARSGEVNLRIDVVEADSAKRSEITNRFADDDFHTTILGLGAVSGYSSSSFTQDLISIGESLHYRSSDVGEWVTAGDTSTMILNEGLRLPTETIDTRGEGIENLITALEISTAEIESGPTMSASSLTVAEAENLGDVPVALQFLLDPVWGWADDQLIEVSVTVDDGHVTNIVAKAADNSEDRADGPLDITTVTGFAALDQPTTIELPAS